MEESNRFRMDEVPAAHINPQIFKLEHKPKTVLAHEIGAGSPCLNCKDDCPGLDLHFWRKICKVCKCRVDDHDVQLQEYDHGKIIIGRLIDPKTMLERQAKISNSQPSMSTKVNIGSPRKHTPNFDVKIRSTTGRSGVEASTQYTWVPTMDAEMIDKYMKMIPEEERPIAGTEGAQCRRKRLAFQLPYHDCDPDAAQSTATAAERDAHHKFIATIKEKVVGMGHIVEWDEQIVRQSLRHNEECHGRQLNNGDGSAAKHCETCKKQLHAGDVGIVTDHGDPTEAWHPNCFRCVTCEQPLVDMLYFYKDGNYYCGRHFGDTMYPRCGGCDELIFAKEYTRAEDKDWHLNHFCCFGCDLELGGHRYMVKSDQPYCLNCYMTKFARLCHRCKNKIGPDVQRISHKELHWHASPECFLCYECNGNLLNKRFIVKNDSVFCSSDCKKDFFDKLEQEQTYSRVQK